MMTSHASQEFIRTFTGILIIWITIEININPANDIIHNNITFNFLPWLNLLLNYNKLLLDYNNVLLDYNNLLPDYNSPIINLLLLL